VFGIETRFFATGGGSGGDDVRSVDLSRLSNLLRICLKSIFPAEASSFVNLNNISMNSIEKRNKKNLTFLLDQYHHSIEFFSAAISIDVI
jgi:hypothetical protein